MNYASAWVNDDVRMFRESVRAFIANEFVPHQARWRAQHGPDAEAWLKAGRAGLLLSDVPEAYGGGGGTFAHEVVVLEELTRAGVHFGSQVHTTVAHYILAYGTEDQKRRWLARREGDHYVISGSKTFITNGSRAGLVCAAVKTNPKIIGMRGISLIVLETAGLGGYRAG